MTVQKTINGIIQFKDISESDLEFYKFKGWAPVDKSSSSSRETELEKTTTFRRHKRHNDSEAIED